MLACVYLLISLQNGPTVRLFILVAKFSRPVEEIVEHIMIHPKSLAPTALDFQIVSLSYSLSQKSHRTLQQPIIFFPV
jgi:hypothetical protein